MTNPYQPGPSPYVTAPLSPVGRPKMFNTKTAQIIWTLVPIVALGIAAAVPFVVAAVKGVIKPWVAAVYAAVEVAVLVAVTLVSGNSAFVGLLLILLMVTSATHTALLDSERITIGK